MPKIDLPASVAGLIRMTPFEDVGLAILREYLPDVKIVSLIPKNAFTENNIIILVRRANGYGSWAGDPRFLDEGSISVQVFTTGDDADERAALVSEACRAALHEAGMNPKYYVGIGSLVRANMLQEPLRKSDWATATGPVQYADLPDGWYRYETLYQLRVRRPLKSLDERFTTQ